MGSVTFTIAAIAMAASTALPPSFKTCRPTWAASGWLDATMPWGARVAARRESKGSVLETNCSSGIDRVPAPDDQRIFRVGRQLLEEFRVAIECRSEHFIR